MRNTNKGLSTLCIPLLTFLVLLTACENPGSVGNEYVDKSDLTFDTLAINQTEAQSYIGYSGRLGYVNIGKYSDAIFGDITATALLKPTVDNIEFPEGDSLDNEYVMKLQLELDSTQVYGDTLSDANFNIYEITSNWNGTNYKTTDDLTYDESSAVGSFTVTDKHSITVDLADSWKDKFATYLYSSGDAADSLFQYEFKGLAIVADDNSGKIIFPRISTSKFLAINDDSEPDTVFFNLRDWAYRIERLNSNYSADISPLHTTVEGMVHMNLSSFIPFIEGKNFVKAEVVFYEAGGLLDSSLPENNVRPSVTGVNLDIGFDTDPAYEFMFGNVELLGSKRTSDRSFRINVTNYFNNYLYGDEDRTDLYLGIGSTSGLLRSTLVYNENAPETLQPIIILTFLEGDN